MSFKLDQIPYSQSTLPVIDYKAAERAQFWLYRQHGVESTIWLVGTEWVLQADDWPHGRFQMVKVMKTYQLWEALDIQALGSGSP